MCVILGGVGWGGWTERVVVGCAYLTHVEVGMIHVFGCLWSSKSGWVGHVSEAL